METDHDGIHELLAGYVLGGLSGDDARAVDRLLAEHVPSCRDCRSTLSGFQAVLGDLALEAEPRTPPEILLPRLHRELGPPPRRRRPVAVAAAAASFVAVMGMAGLAVSQGIRASNAVEREALISEALRFSNRPDANTSSLGVPGDPSGDASEVVEVTAPGVESVYLICHDAAPPSPGMIYRVWLGSNGTYRYATEFVPDPGITVLRLQFDPSTVDSVLITEEPLDRAPTQPDTTAVRWSDAA